MNKDFLQGGNFNKFIVIKNEDIEKYLTHKMKIDLWTCLAYINDGRYTHGKKDDSTYLVIDTDEPYAPEIVEILKKNGHWS